jgi:hypothetical protein
LIRISSSDASPSAVAAASSSFFLQYKHKSILGYISYEKEIQKF